MQVTIRQLYSPVNPLAHDTHGKWFAMIRDRAETTDNTTTYFNKPTKTFVLAIEKPDDAFTSSPGLIAHLVHKAFPAATITILPSVIE
jgi:hypothetical protein